MEPTELGAEKNQGRQFKLSALVAFRTGGLHQKIPHKGFCSFHSIRLESCHFVNRRVDYC